MKTMNIFVLIPRQFILHLIIHLLIISEYLNDFKLLS